MEKFCHLRLELLYTTYITEAKDKYFFERRAGASHHILAPA